MISMRRYDWVLHLATIALCAYLVATTAVTYVAGMLEAGAEITQAKGTPSVASPASKIPANFEEYQVIFDRNFFNSTNTGVAQQKEESMDITQLGELGPAVKTSLDIKLIGALVIEDGKDRRSSATIVGGKEKGAAVYFAADEKSFAPNVKITQVSKNKIEFINNGRLEYLEMEDPAKRSIFASVDEVFGKAGGEPGEKVADAGESGGKIVVDQKEVDDALQNLDRLYNEVRIVPNFKDGRPAGMKVLSVKPGSIISKLGVRRGDVLQKVNGQELDLKKGMDLFNQMKDLRNFSVEIERGGKNQTLEYEIR